MRLLLSCLVVGLVLAGCSSAEEGVDEADELAEGLAAMYAGDHPDPDDVAEGDCFADALLAATTPEQLRDGGLVDASYVVVTEIPALPEDLAGTVADAQLACTDFVEDSTAAQVSITKGRLDARGVRGLPARHPGRRSDPGQRHRVVDGLVGGPGPGPAQRGPGELRRSVTRGGPIQHGPGGSPAVTSMGCGPAPHREGPAHRGGDTHVHPAHPRTLHAPRRAPRPARHLARGVRHPHHGVARGHLRLHRRRHVRRRRPVRVARGGDGQLGAARAG